MCYPSPPPRSQHRITVTINTPIFPGFVSQQFCWTLVERLLQPFNAGVAPDPEAHDGLDKPTQTQGPDRDDESLGMLDNLPRPTTYQILADEVEERSRVERFETHELQNRNIEMLLFATVTNRHLHTQRIRLA
uniref:Uncharacterized protein n=1 Tax=Steinernema glaseri TaxID=37863 RepID=A0A1I7ZCV8_9BILA